MKDNNDKLMSIKCVINDSYSKSWCNKVEPEGNINF